MVKKIPPSQGPATHKKEIISDYVRLTLKEETKPGEVYRKLRRKITIPKQEE